MMPSLLIESGPTSPNIEPEPEPKLPNYISSRNFKHSQRLSYRCCRLSHYLVSPNFLMYADCDIRLLLDLDDDIIIEIFQFLDVPSILVLRKVIHTAKYQGIVFKTTEPVYRHAGGCF